ncbi:hypothetical protein Pelo_19272 [Pelomyxa schiedti]|nr:hypothetical protein Pelo_19272 [Pelomyxa schiedti]
MCDAQKPQSATRVCALNIDNEERGAVSLVRNTAINKWSGLDGMNFKSLTYCGNVTAHIQTNSEHHNFPVSTIIVTSATRNRLIAAPHQPLPIDSLTEPAEPHRMYQHPGRLQHPPSIAQQSASPSPRPSSMFSSALSSTQ